MLDELSDRIGTYLASRSVGIVSATGGVEEWAQPVRYRLVTPPGHASLMIACLLPRWSELVFRLEQDARVLLTVPDPGDAALRWLQCRGMATLLPPSDWSACLPSVFSCARLADLYVEGRITPKRIDLVDEARGWGMRETLEF